MSWPDPADYQDAIQNPRVCFKDPELKSSSVGLTKMGLPRVAAGNFASVYEVTDGSRRWAVRCFLRQVSDQHRRYSLLSQHLAGFILPCVVGFDYIDEGILVRGEWYPIVKMEWVEGYPLNVYLEENVANPGTLTTLARRWRGLVNSLRGNHLAHGDLQHGNVLVTPRGDLKLVDYDAMFVPSLEGELSPELGHPNYQHPGRQPKHYDGKLDSFSALVIYTSLLALAQDQSLWQLHTGENLILSASDYKEVKHSKGLQRIKNSHNPVVKKLGEKLEEFCFYPLVELPFFENAVADVHDSVYDGEGSTRRPSSKRVDSFASISSERALVKSSYSENTGASLDDVLKRLPSMDSAASELTPLRRRGRTVESAGEVIEPVRQVKLRLIHGLSDWSPEPLWYKEQAERLRQHILAPNRKPALLTGYDRFGGSLIATWSVQQAARELAMKSAATEESVVNLIRVDLVGGEPECLLMRLTDWVMEVRYERASRQFKKTFKHALYDPNFADTSYEVKELSNTYRSGGFRLVLRLGPVELALGSHELNKSSISAPPARRVQLHGLLHQLANALPPDHSSTWTKYVKSILVRDRAAYRTVVLVDKVGSWKHLEVLLGSFPREGGSLRIISIVDKYDYDEWKRNKEYRTLIERGFDVITCLPLWGIDIATQLCKRYFEVEDSVCDDLLFRDFADGLNFHCSGSPGEFSQALRDHWGVQNENDILTLSSKSDAMKDYQNWARLGRLLSAGMDEMLKDNLPSASPRDVGVGETEARAKLLLYSIGHLAARNDLSAGELVLESRRRRDRIGLRISDDKLIHLCDRVTALASYL